MVRTEKSVTVPGNGKDSEVKVESFIKSVRKDNYWSGTDRRL
jgi:hypothetical protein